MSPVWKRAFETIRNMKINDGAKKAGGLKNGPAAKKKTSPRGS